MSPAALTHGAVLHRPMRPSGQGAQTRSLQESPWIRISLITAALGFMALFLMLPLAAVFAEALRKGLSACQ